MLRESLGNTRLVQSRVACHMLPRICAFSDRGLAKLDEYANPMRTQAFQAAQPSICRACARMSEQEAAGSVSRAPPAAHPDLSAQQNEGVVTRSASATARPHSPSPSYKRQASQEVFALQQGRCCGVCLGTVASARACPDSLAAWNKSRTACTPRPRAVLFAAHLRASML